MKQILHLHTFLNITCGITRVIYQIAAPYEGKPISSEYSHHIAAFGGDNLEKYHLARIPVNLIKYKKGGVFDLLKAAIFIRKYCISNKIDIIHSHHRYFDLAAYIASRGLKVKTVTSVHSKVKGKRILSYKADQLIAVGNEVKKHLINYFNVEEDRISVINNFVIPELFNKKENDDQKEKHNIKEKYNINKKALIVSFIGRFSKEKGIDNLLYAFKELSSKRDDIILLIIGSGEEEKWLSEFIEANKLPAIMVKAEQKIADYFNASDIIILPSRVDPFPLVMIEAGYFKKAFIGSRVDGIMEFIEDKTDGILISPEDTKAIIQSIELLADNKELRLRYGNKLYQKVISGYTPSKIFPKYMDIYDAAK